LRFFRVNTLKYRSEIDGLRALAVLSVVIYHVSPQSLPGGFLGVDIFFVISGYLISLIILREQAAGTFSFVNFYARRARRLFPSLSIVLLATIIFGFFSLFADEYRRLGKHAFSAIIFLLNFQLQNEANYFDIASASKPLLHLWSLSIEEQFYFVWPTLFIVLGYLRLRISVVISVLTVSSFAFAIYLASRNPITLYFHPLSRFWEPLLGTMLAYYHYRFGINTFPMRIDQLWIRHLLSCAGLGAIFFSLFLFNGKMPHPNTLTLIPLLGVILCIASGTRSIGARFMAIKPIVGIGLISYPLYLWHWPILSYIRIIESGMPAQTLLWIGASAAVLFAVLTYRFIEQPLRQSRRVHPVLIGLGSTMIVLLLISFSLVAFDGFPDRPALHYVKAVEAQMQREPATDEFCLGLFKSGNAPVYCRQHNPSAQMIGLIGDSHAHALFTGVSELAEKQGYGTLLLANSGCPTLLGAVVGRDDVELQQCAKSIEKIIDTMLADKRIVSVVIASRGPQYLNGLGFGPVEASDNYPPITNLDRGYQSNPEKVFADGLASTATQLHQRGIRISYLLQVPELGVPALDCFGRPLTMSQQLLNKCTVEYETYQRRMQIYRTLVLNLVERIPFLQVIDVESTFCDAGGGAPGSLIISLCMLMTTT